MFRLREGDGARGGGGPKSKKQVKSVQSIRRIKKKRKNRSETSHPPCHDAGGKRIPQKEGGNTGHRSEKEKEQYTMTRGKDGTWKKNNRTWDSSRKN